MDNDFSIDYGDLIQAIEGNDVITMRFVTIGQRLLFDFRSSELDGPLVKLVAPVKSVRERYESLKALRPRFQLPERIVSVSWPRFARTLPETPVWDAVIARVAESNHPEAIMRARAMGQELERMEAREQQRAIRGVGFRTLWSQRARRQG